MLARLFLASFGWCICNKHVSVCFASSLSDKQLHCHAIKSVATYHCFASIQIQFNPSLLFDKRIEHPISTSLCSSLIYITFLKRDALLRWLLLLALHSVTCVFGGLLCSCCWFSCMLLFLLAACQMGSYWRGQSTWVGGGHCWC